MFVNKLLDMFGLRKLHVYARSSDTYGLGRRDVNLRVQILNWFSLKGKVMPFI